VYDGNGSRIKKTEGGQTVVYVNQYYAVNTTTSNATSSYYLGNKLIATMEKGVSENGTLRYVHQDHLTSTSLMTNQTGNQIGDTVKYLPFGETRANPDIPTDKLFTGQRLDGTGLYYYNARYYDPTIGRFISPDTVIQSMANPQCFNRYSYCLNNPLKYTDPSGHDSYSDLIAFCEDYYEVKDIIDDLPKEYSNSLMDLLKIPDEIRDIIDSSAGIIEPWIPIILGPVTFDVVNSGLDGPDIGKSSDGRTVAYPVKGDRIRIDAPGADIYTSKESFDEILNSGLTLDDFSSLGDQWHHDQPTSFEFKGFGCFNWNANGALDIKPSDKLGVWDVFRNDGVFTGTILLYHLPNGYCTVYTIVNNDPRNYKGIPQNPFKL
jgi:RHS repeat-associated protein